MTIVKEQTVTPAVNFFADKKKYHYEQVTGAPNEDIALNHLT